MTQFTYMAIKVADEQEFNTVAEKLWGMGYYTRHTYEFRRWREDKTHVLTYNDGDFGLYIHCAEHDPDYTRYTYEQFMQL
jgi:hypothetical protein